MSCMSSVSHSTLSCQCSSSSTKLPGPVSSTSVDGNTFVDFLDRMSRPSLSAFVLSRLDYCNAVLASLTKSTAAPLQLFQMQLQDLLHVCSFFAGRGPAYSGPQRGDHRQAQCSCPGTEKGNWLVCAVCARRAWKVGNWSGTY